MHDESNKQPCCNPPWEPPQVIPAQVRRVNNLIFRKINQFHRENNVDNVTPMHDWIMSYLYWHKNEPVYQRAYGKRRNEHITDRDRIQNQNDTGHYAECRRPQ